MRLSDPQDPSYLEVRIKTSKMDPFRHGVSVIIGRTSDELCVAAIAGYMVQRGAEAGPFFRYPDGRALMRERFVKAVRAALVVAGYNSSQYAGHSFRIGVATTAAQRGVQDSLIKTLGLRLVGECRLLSVYPYPSGGPL